jgi:hypothetical protein
MEGVSAVWDNLHSLSTYSVKDGQPPLEFPVNLALVLVDNLNFSLARGRGTAYILDNECLALIRAIENKIIAEYIYPQHPSSHYNDDRLMYLASTDSVTCVSMNGKKTYKMDSKDISGKKCTLQVIARPSNVWGYENDQGCYISGMSWDIDRLYISNDD